MAFGFSATDFVKAIELVIQLGDALRATSEARSRFRDLIHELYALENALLQVKRLDLDGDLEMERRALCSAASQCQLSIDRFSKKISKLQPHMQPFGTGSFLKDGLAKITWALCKKEDVEQFRATIRGHTISITILLDKVQLKASTRQLMLLDLQGEKLEEQHKSITDVIQKVSCQMMAELDDVSKKAGESAQHGRALLGTSAEVVNTNLRVYTMVKDIYALISRLPAQVERQQPIVFTDAFNRIRPFHLEFVKSEEAFLSIMRHDFRDMRCDLALLKNRRYVIDELGTGNKVDQTMPWELRFNPGQRVGMSMVFKGVQAEISTCPRCHREHEGAVDGEITWSVRSQPLVLI